MRYLRVYIPVTDPPFSGVGHIALGIFGLFWSDLWSLYMVRLPMTIDNRTSVLCRGKTKNRTCTLYFKRLTFGLYSYFYFNVESKIRVRHITRQSRVIIIRRFQNFCVRFPIIINLEFHFRPAYFNIIQN